VGAVNPVHRERVVTTRGAVLSFARAREALPSSTRRPVAHRAEPGGSPDEPWHVTAEQVDELLGEVLERVAEAVAEERAVLRNALKDGRLSTDELRLALRRCRGLLDDLLEL